MKNLSRYLILAAVILLVFLWMTNNAQEDYARVETFRGASLHSDVFYPLIAANVNAENLISIKVNGEVYENENNELIADNSMQLMAALPFLRDVLDVSVHAYPDDTITLERGSISASFTVGSRVYTINSENAQLSAEPVKKGGLVYLPLKHICDMTGAELFWNNTTYAAKVDTSEMKKLRLPSSYNLSDYGQAPAVTDQGDDDTCWAYASCQALTSSLMPEKQETFSPEDMVKNKGYSFSDTDGGDYMMALSYLLSWTGDSDVHLQEARFFSHDDLKGIKKSIYKYGAVTTSFYIDSSSSSYYYDPYDYSYCYQGSNKSNHDVVLIGWDDNYSASNFRTYVPGNGAFIALNSWGSGFGNDGIFYISYYDSNIGDQSVSYTRVENADNYDIIHQSDRYGWTGQIGFNKEDLTAASVYKADQKEIIKAVGFYALSKNTEYKIYLVRNFTDVSSLNNRVKVAGGKLTDAGYYTINLNQDYTVPAGGRFAIVLYIDSPGISRPMAIEYKTARMTDSQIDISDGEGYVSKNGLAWESVEKTADGNLCLKVYADKYKEK